MSDLLFRLQDLVLLLSLPEPEYFLPLPDGGELLLAYPDWQVALADAPTEAPGWRLFACHREDAASIEAALRALAAHLGYEEPAHIAGVATVAERPAMRVHTQVLTQAQRAAVQHAGGPARILAGAGTGKTTVMVARFHHLVRQGVDPARILTLTFSREAARALRDAILPGVPAAARLYIQTFHSFCLGVLEAEGQSGLRLIPEAERRAMLASSCLNAAFGWYTGGRRRLLEDEALAFIGQAKDYLLTPADVAAHAAATQDSRLADLADAYRLYQDELQRQEGAEFSDFIAKAVALLEQEVVVAARWQQRFDHILVDEFQDTNLAQYRVLQVLTRPHGNLVVVGDDDQAIYRFRGASEQYLVRFPAATTYKVEENFRCSAPVLAVANRLIEHNAPDRLPKALYTTTRTDGYPEVAHWEAATEREEAEAVAASIARRMATEGARAGEFAILCRSLRRSGDEFARALTRRQIPYRWVGEEAVHPAMTQTLALLRLMRRPGGPDLLTVMAALTPPAELYAALRAVKGDLGRLVPPPAVAAWLEAHRDATLEEQVYQGLKFLGHLRLSMAPTPADVARLTAGREMQAHAADATTYESLEAACHSGGGSRSGSAHGDAVTLMTVHAAKGLEFPVVFVTALADGLFPVAVDSTPVYYAAEAVRNAAPLPDVGQRLTQHIREERRLAYVALTRARNELILTRARRYGQQEAEPSRFLTEMGAPPPARVEQWLHDPIPDARAYLLKAVAGGVPADPQRLAEAIRVQQAAPGAIPLRRQEPPAPFAPGAAGGLRLSASALEAYKECPRRYYYGQVLRLPDEGSLAAAFGSAVHAVMDRYHKAIQAGQGEPERAEVISWLPGLLNRADCETEGQYRQLLRRGEVFIGRYLDWARGRWREIINVEGKFDVPYTDSTGRTHRLVGRYDLIARGPDGAVEIIDFKTGHRKGSTTVNKRVTRGSDNNADRKLQLGIYYLAHFGGEVDPGARVTYIFLRHPEDKYPATFIEPFNAKDEQVIGCAHTAASLALIRQDIDAAIDGILANCFDRTEDEDRCKYCPYADVCEVTPHDWY